MLAIFLGQVCGTRDRGRVAAAGAAQPPRSSEATMANRLPLAGESGPNRVSRGVELRAFASSRILLADSVSLALRHRADRGPRLWRDDRAGDVRACAAARDHSDRPAL